MFIIMFILLYNQGNFPWVFVEKAPNITGIFKFSSACKGMFICRPSVLACLLTAIDHLLCFLLHLLRASLSGEYQVKCQMIVIVQVVSITDCLHVYFNLYQVAIHTSSNACISLLCILIVMVYVIMPFDNG